MKKVKQDNVWWVRRSRGEGLWEEVTFNLKKLATRKIIPGRRNSKCKGPEAGTAGVLEEQKGYCGWRGVVKRRVEGNVAGNR